MSDVTGQGEARSRSLEWMGSRRSGAGRWRRLGDGDSRARRGRAQIT